MGKIQTRCLVVALFLSPLSCLPALSTDYDCLSDSDCEQGDFCQGETNNPYGVCAPGTDADGDDSEAGVDCDDEDATRYPGHSELCDGVDNDCNGLDDFDNPGVDDQEIDGDGDGSIGCEDCDDGDARNFPGNSEVCDGVDNDCNGLDDFDNPGVDDQEIDGDGDGSIGCEDCDDSDNTIFPDATEVCDNPVDEDCDGSEDYCWLDVDVGWGVTCGVRKTGGAVLCWGDDIDDLEDEPAGPFTHVSVNRNRACALRENGSVACWDRIGTTIEDEPGPWSQISSGDNYTCALDAGGELFCWPAQANAPTDPMAQISAWGNHNCGVRTDSSLACWGDGPNDPPSGESYSYATAGSNVGCAVRLDGEIVCWSNNDDFKNGVPDGPLCQVDATGGGGSGFICAVKGGATPCTGGQVLCWGPNSMNESPPARTDFVKVVTSHISDSSHACGLTSTDLIRCWGQELHGNGSYLAVPEM